MERLKGFLLTFVCITTAVVFATAVYITVFWKEAVLGVEILWQILIVSFTCCFGVFIHPKKELSKRKFLIHAIIQYLYTNIIVLGSGIYFEWFYIDQFPMVAGMFIMIAIIFVGITLFLSHRDKQLATGLNEKLEEYHKKRNNLS